MIAALNVWLGSACVYYIGVHLGPALFHKPFGAARWSLPVVAIGIIAGGPALIIAIVTWFLVQAKMIA